MQMCNTHTQTHTRSFFLFFSRRSRYSAKSIGLNFQKAIISIAPSQKTHFKVICINDGLWVSDSTRAQTHRHSFNHFNAIASTSTRSSHPRSMYVSLRVCVCVSVCELAVICDSQLNTMRTSQFGGQQKETSIRSHTGQKII